MRSVVKKTIRWAFAVAILFACPFSAQAATNGWNQTGAGPYDYGNGANWAGGRVNAVWDASLTNTANQVVTFGADTTLAAGLSFAYAGAYNLTLRSDGVANRQVILGADVTVNPVNNQTVTFGSALANSGLNVNLGGTTRVFTVTGGRTLACLNSVTNGALAVTGGGTLKLTNATGIAVAVGVSVDGGTMLALMGGSGTVLRARSITLDGSSTLSIDEVANGTNSVDAVSGALTLNSGLSTVQVRPKSAFRAQLACSNLVRTVGSLGLFRGASLGQASLASGQTNVANVLLAAPALVGGGGATNTTTVGIVVGVYGDTNWAGNGLGLMTHDSACGLRLLDSSKECKAGLTDGQTQLDNILLTNTSGTSVLTTTLTRATTIVNSLSIGVSGPGTNSGVVIAGSAGTTLKLNSGAIFANQSCNAPVASDAMLISVPTLDLNGSEGTIVAFAKGLSNGTTPAPLEIDSAIGNDGGHGLTVGSTTTGGGVLKLGGSAANTYSGVTTLNSGELWLGKSGGVNAIPGDLVIHGGYVLDSTGNQIADTASITMDGSSRIYFSSSFNSGSGSSETFSNLTMRGGLTGYASSHSDNTLAIKGAAMLLGGTLYTYGQSSVAGLTTVAGGLLNVQRGYNSTTTYQAVTTLAGGLAVVQAAAGVYTAVVVAAGSSSTLGGELALSSDVAFTGSLSNGNTTVIAAPDGVNPGIVMLNGTRTFDVGDGAAAEDLTLSAPLLDGLQVGGLTKSGAGTLALAGTNSYTGPTRVSSGVLAVNGSLASPVTVGSNAVLTGTGVLGAAGVGSLILTGRLFGVNLSGGEFGSVPGTYNADYVYPTDSAEWNYYRRKGLTLIRMPFRWARVQKTLNGELDATEMARIDAVIALARARGMKVILDMHDYDHLTVAGTSYLIGATAVPYAAFRDVWHRLADRYRADPGLYAYGLMNEPNATGGTWPLAAQAAIDGIRETDTTNIILVAGDSWSSALLWPTVNTNLNVTDPCGKIIYEAHCYFDHDSSGTYTRSYDGEGAYPTIGVDRVKPFVDWLKAHGARGFIGEYGIPTNDVRWLTVLDNFQAYLNTNGVSGTYWAGGPWWGSYILSCEPDGGYTLDKPQMSVLQNYTNAWRGAGPGMTALTVEAGGIVDPGTVGGVGTLTVAGDVFFRAGSTLRIDRTMPGTTTDVLVVAGRVIGEGGSVHVSLTATGAGPWKVMQAVSIAPTFATDSAGLELRTRDSGTTLWIEKKDTRRSLIIVR